MPANSNHFEGSDVLIGAFVGFMDQFEHGAYKVASQISLKRLFEGLPTRPSVDGLLAPHGLN